MCKCGPDSCCDQREGRAVSAVFPDMLSPANRELREASDRIADTRPLVGFLYELMRDHLTPGVVQELLVTNQLPPSLDSFQFCNGFLAQYAQHVADRLVPASEEGTTCGGPTI